MTYFDNITYTEDIWTGPDDQKKGKSLPRMIPQQADCCYSELPLLSQSWIPLPPSPQLSDSDFDVDSSVPITPFPFGSISITSAPTDPKMKLSGPKANTHDTSIPASTPMHLPIFGDDRVSIQPVPKYHQEELVCRETSQPHSPHSPSFRTADIAPSGNHDFTYPGLSRSKFGTISPPNSRPYTPVCDFHLSSNGTSLSSPHRTLLDNDSDSDTPYSKLIYKAMLDAPGHQMTLKEIYDWFRRNTKKVKDETSDGWRNSIRHNLSMNKV